VDKAGKIHDVLRHGKDTHRQSIIHVSSTDPWHRSSDRDPNTAQPSPLSLWQLGLTDTKSIMLPVGVLYDTPENALAEIQHFKNANLPVDQVELGEEPDGQLVAAADYGALYVEFSRLIRNRYPDIKTGGPSLVNGVSDAWLDAGTDQSWTSQFLTYLRDHRALDQLGFFSFEYFPFDDVCGSTTGKLLQQTGLMSDLFQRLNVDRVPHQIPWVITEYGLSAFSGRALVEVPSALLNADIVGDFLIHGGRTAYLYGYSPNAPIPGDSGCAGQGNTMLWETDAGGKAVWPMPTYYGDQMMTRSWARLEDGEDQLFRATTSLKDGHGRSLVSAYPLRRPDGHWAVMLINRSIESLSASIDFQPTSPSPHGAITVEQYSPSRYRWRATSKGGHPVLDKPPVHSRLDGWSRELILPPLSLTVAQD